MAGRPPHASRGAPPRGPHAGGPPEAPGDVPLEVHEAGGLQELREDWERLAREDGDLFRSFAWAEALEQGAGAERRRLLVFTRPDGVVVGIAPLVRLRSSPIRVYGFAGQGIADQVGAVCHPRDRAVVAAALRRAILREPGRTPAALLGRGLLREEGWAPLLGGVVVGAQPSLVLPLDGGWDAWLASRSSNFRQQVRGRERRLLRDHGLVYHRITEAAELEEALPAMVALHHVQWQGRSSFFSGPGGAVQLAFARAASQAG